ncbi:MAG: chloride channel protein [Alphaproteobacteria bacterium]|nr:chloride channel protein [Alphaproteobacteria bacterium]
MMVQRVQHLFTHGQRSVIYLLGGLSVGAAAIAMAFGADEAQRLFQETIAGRPYLAFVITPVGFAIAAWITRSFLPSAQGSGIPQVIAARHVKDPEAQNALVSLRVAIGKILLMMFGLLAGASTGREGPTVQVGASIMFALRRFSPQREYELMLAGAAAGVSAAFNTPLAGIVFAIEELSRSFETRTSGLLIGSVIAAGLTSLAILGNYAYFGVTFVSIPIGADWLAIVVVGILGGLAGGLFGRVVVAAAFGLPGRIGALMKDHPIVTALICGLVVAACGTAGSPSVFGTGYTEARAIIHGDVADLTFGPLKFMATVFSAVSGIPGGIFAPSLAIGAGLGSDMSLLFPTIPVGALALLGMVAYLTGVVQAPLTSFVIVFEMTNDNALVLPLMAVALIAQFTSKLVLPEGLYHALARKYLVNQNT